MLTVVEARVLGCLLEKQRTVPDQYPLTLNALVSACNQTSSRDPIMQLSDHDVDAGVTSLKAAGLVRLVHPSHGRSVTRFRQVADEAWELDGAASALVAVLLLRGPQTVAELRTRTERQHPFSSLDEVQHELDGLAGREMVRLLERRPGQKEQRWQQVLADETQTPAPVAHVAHIAQANPLDEGEGAEEAEPIARDERPAFARPAVGEPSTTDVLTARVAELEARVAALETALADLL